MIDITSADATGLGTYDTQTPKAANILSVQLGSLEYAQDLGIDLDYFLNQNIKFQNESFKAYLVETLANNGINTSSIIETVENLYSQYLINLAPEETSTGMLAR